MGCEKANLNFKKDGIDFADAVGVLEDEWALTIEQEIVKNEQRFASIGIDFVGQMIVAVYTYRGDDIRLISARPATKQERNVYEQRRV
jgi:hypothetical protein